MIKDFVNAWNIHNKDLLQSFIDDIPESYSDIVVRVVEKVINPYLTETEDISYPESEGLNIKRMTTIDDGDYQGTTLYLIPFNTYQPSVEDYVVTHNYYGSCSVCDVFEGIQSNFNLWGNKPTKKDIKGAAKAFHSLALHILQRFKKLDGEDDNE